MSESTKAVFLSYAREDADAARRIAEALRSTGIEVWFDQNELRGGDTWDAKIRKQINDCTLFLPIISAHTQERGKGYFRLEWKLAVEQTHQMAEGMAFLAPVVVDDTPESNAIVPPEFMRVQWTRLPGALPTPQFVAQVRQLLDKPAVLSAHSRPAVAGLAEAGRSGSPTPPAKKTIPGWTWGAFAAVVVGVVTALMVARKPAASSASPAVTAVMPAAGKPSAASPAPAVTGDNRSIAVLAFADLSEARNSEYFSDGISEELLNVLAKVPGLRVAARTSAFYFKGKNLPIAEIAAKLNVAYVVEGSVQRAGDSVRITAQLIKAADGYHVWSEHFDRDLKNVFAVQDEIAGLIAQNLSLKLGVSSGAATAEVNPQAFEWFLQARQDLNLRTTEGVARSAALLERALALDPNFARAHAMLAVDRLLQAVEQNKLGLFNQRDTPVVDRIRGGIDRALQLDPNLAEPHASLGALYWHTWRIPEAVTELRRAIALNPSYATAHQWLGRVLMLDGRLEEGEAALRRATELDPLSHRILDNYSSALDALGRPAEALAMVDRALALQPDSLQALTWKALYLSELGRREEALTLLKKTPWAGTEYQVSALETYVRAGALAEAEQLHATMLATATASEKLHNLVWLGRPQEALAFVDAASTHAQGGGGLFDAVYDPIRGDPRFGQLLATLGLTEANARMQAWRAAQPPAKAK